MKKEKIRLLVTASTFPRWREDTEPRFVFDLVKHLDNEFDVTVLVPWAPGSKEKEILEGVNILRYHYFPIHKMETLCYPGAILPRIEEKKARILLVPFLFLSLWFNLLVRVNKYDIVHAHWIIPQGIIQSLFKKPYIVTGHGGDVTSLNNRLIFTLKKRCLKRAKYVTVVSEYLKEKVCDIIPETKVKVISMGVDTGNFGKRFRIDNYFNQGNRKVVLFVGRLVEKKGIKYLIEAMEKIDAVLVIVGTGPLEKELKTKSKKIENRIRFLGNKSHNELKKIYSSSDIFVAPSVIAKNGDQEGLPTTILEAMASDIPVIASNYGGMKELITSYKNGILCDPGSVEQIAMAIKRLCCDEKLYEEIVKNARMTIKEYDYENIAKQFSEIIRYVNMAYSK